MTPVNPRVASCRYCQALIRIPDNVYPGHHIHCTHCGTWCYAWQLLARSYRPEVKPDE